MDIFSAVADPSRRLILERLREEGPRSLSELSAPLPMSRQAVKKHLRILEDCGLVESARSGRTRMHRLRARPLEALDAWLAPYAAAWDRRLDRLKTHLDGDGS